MVGRGGCGDADRGFEMLLRLLVAAASLPILAN